MARRTKAEIEADEAAAAELEADKSAEDAPADPTHVDSSDDVAAREDDSDDSADDSADDDDRADGPISLGVDPKSQFGEDYTVTYDHRGRPVHESFSGRKFSTLAEEVGDPTIVQPEPGGPKPEAGLAFGHNGD